MVVQGQVSPILSWQNTRIPSEEFWWADEVSHLLISMEARGNNVFFLGHNNYEETCWSPGSYMLHYTSDLGTASTSLIKL